MSLPISFENVEKAITQMHFEKPEYLIAEDQLEEYLSYSSAELLSADDAAIQSFLIQVIHLAVRLQDHKIQWHPDVIESANEANWKAYELEYEQDLGKYIDYCFESSDEEELLAIVEDSLHEEIEPASAAIIWISCKNLIDSIEQDG